MESMIEKEKYKYMILLMEKKWMHDYLQWSIVRYYKNIKYSIKILNLSI